MDYFTRRRFIKGIGGSLASLLLPQFHSYGQARIGQGGIPTRSVFIGMGYGVSKSGWFPEPVAGKLKLTRLLKPMERHKDDISIIQNLSFVGKSTGKAKGHTSALYYLSDATGVNPKSRLQKALPTCDQIIAKMIGHETPFPSVAIGFNKPTGLNEGHGPGIRSLSWDMQGRHITGLKGSLGMYQALFANANVNPRDLDKQFSQKRSVLDFLVKDIKSLNSKLSINDQHALEQYTQGLRDVELNIGRSLNAAKQQQGIKGIEKPESYDDGISEVKTVYDLIALAMQADLSRVFTYTLPVASIINSLGLPRTVNTHEMSHQKTKVSRAQHQARDLENVKMLAYFFDKLKSIQQPDGRSLFDHSMITFGGGLRTHHYRGNVPILFAGYGGGGIRQGYNVVNQSRVTPLTNLWLSHIRHYDPNVKKFHTSKNVVSEVFTS